jgi:hypothetical protein
MANETLVRNLTNDAYGFVDLAQYYTACSVRTGIANNATVTAFSATNPWITIFNTEAVGGKSIFLDYVTMSATAAGTAGASLQCAVTLDAGNRYTSGGTALSRRIRQLRRLEYLDRDHQGAGDLTATRRRPRSATSSAMRYLKGAIPVIGDEYTLKFGGVDAPTFFGISTIIKSHDQRSEAHHPARLDRARERLAALPVGRLEFRAQPGLDREVTRT